MTREFIVGACPEPQMLSAYLDGKLDPTERGRIEDHISRCEDCYFVVRETALVWADAKASGGAEAVQATPGEDAAAPASPVVATPAADRGRPKASSLIRYLMPLAATVVVAAGALALWRQATRPDSYEDTVRPLVDAVGERRFFEPRLTGGFRYGPAVSVNRSSGSAPASETWDVRAAAGELIDRSAPSVAGRASRAAAALFTGSADEAVVTYSQLVQEEPQSAEWASNLAAALIVRASSGADTEGPAEGAPGANGQRDKEEALRLAQLALRLDPALSEARFNLGLALKLMGRVGEARQVFSELEARSDPWREAAREQLRSLPEAPEARQ